jgi:hypothetical protein
VNIWVRFKLQFFRTAAPSVSWNHAAPASSSNEQPFAYTGASLEQQAVYEAAWDWLRDADPEPPSPFLLSASELGAGLLSDKEYERVSSAYSLGRRASAGDVAAAEILESALRGEDDDRSRSAMYGLGGAGEAVVQLLLRTLRDSRVARDWRTQINAAHGLCEAVRTPSSEVQTELTLTLDAAVGVMAECVAESQGLGVRELSAAELAAISKANGPAYHEKKATATAGYLEDEANALIVSSVRRCYSACIHALGTMGERAVAAGDHEMVNSLAETLLPFTVAPDPGASLEQYGNNGRASRELQCPMLPHASSRLVSSRLVWRLTRMQYCNIGLSSRRGNSAGAVRVLESRGRRDWLAPARVWRRRFGKPRHRVDTWTPWVRSQ